MSGPAVGDWVKVLDAGPDDPLHIQIRPTGIVDEVLPGDRYMVRHGLPGEGTYGPFPRERLRSLP